jgi:hypothetical protein
MRDLQQRRTAAFSHEQYWTLLQVAKVTAVHGDLNAQFHASQIAWRAPSPSVSSICCSTIRRAGSDTPPLRAGSAG